ncbi:MAG: hypothetical protein QOE45_2536 [Frankiaceae bacterium]|jgi:microcystin-dependent protein|nr:hypothetical protein [Frankiaceae bacterium]
MGTPFLGEVKIIPWNFAPQGWAFCNGQLLPINQNQALFSLYGTTFGGNGQTTFGLPNLQGRVALHRGNDFILGQVGGETTHTLTIAELTQHLHLVNADTTQAPDNGNAPAPTKRLAGSQPGSLYGPPNNLIAMNPGAVSNVGGSQAHDNMQPYTVLNFICALVGVFPSRN